MGGHCGRASTRRPVPQSLAAALFGRGEEAKRRLCDLTSRSSRICSPKPPTSLYLTSPGSSCDMLYTNGSTSRGRALECAVVHVSWAPGHQTAPRGLARAAVLFWHGESAPRRPSTRDFQGKLPHLMMVSVVISKATRVCGFSSARSTCTAHAPHTHTHTSAHAHPGTIVLT